MVASVRLIVVWESVVNGWLGADSVPVGALRWPVRGILQHTSIHHVLILFADQMPDSAGILYSLIYHKSFMHCQIRYKLKTRSAGIDSAISVSAAR